MKKRPATSEIFGLACTLLVLICVTVAHTATAEAPPADCLSCHRAAVQASKFTHGPVGVGLCSVCHIEEKPGTSAIRVGPDGEM